MTTRTLFFLWLLTVFMGGPGAAGAQPSTSDLIERRLVDMGYEYVRVDTGSAGLRIHFENRIMRYDLSGLMEVAGIVYGSTGAPERVTFVPRRRGLPLAEVVLTETEYHRLADRPRMFPVEPSSLTASPSVGTNPSDSPRERIFPGGLNPSTFKLDIVVHPQFAAQFGSFSDAVRSQFNLTPEARLGLWPGMQLTGQLIIPLQNELAEAEDDVRPGILAFNQTLRLPGRLSGNTFLSATAGYFTRNRYGMDFEVLVTPGTGRFEFGGRLGRTGFARYVDGEWQYASLDTWTRSVSAGYNVARYALSVRATYARFLRGDSGVVVDVDRRFGEFEVGFFGIVSDEGENAGFRIAIPLFMRKHMKPGRVRIRSADSFRWGYRYRGLTESGLRYETGHSLDEFRGVWVAPFVPGLTARPPTRY